MAVALAEGDSDWKDMLNESGLMMGSPPRVETAWKYMLCEKARTPPVAGKVVPRVRVRVRVRVRGWLWLW